MRRALSLLLVTALASGCASAAPERAYFPSPSDPKTAALAQALWRAAVAAGDDPARYSFAMLGSRDVSAWTADDATFYFSEGLAARPAAVIDALVAHEVAHEVLGHAGRRRTLALSLGAGFTVAGVVVPGLGLLDLLARPLIVRAYTRDQEIAADLKAADLLRAMGYEAPRRTLAAALRDAAAINGPPRGGWLASEPALADRLAALEPLETLAAAAPKAPTSPSRP
jgi:predicted Zn-dependent protease